MDILVCVKQVPDDSVEIHLNPSTMKPDLSKTLPQANAFDTYALEMAVRYCEANGGTVSVVSFGPKDNETSLRSCLAVGAKNAFLVSDEGLEDADPSVTAAVLAAAVPKIEEALGTKFGLIMVGKESTDYIDGVVGPIMAEKLGLPFVTNIVAVEGEEGALNLKKELDAGYDILKADGPAIVTVSKPDYDPRFPSIKTKMAARKAKIAALTAADLGMDDAAKAPKIEYVSFINPPKKQAGEKIIEDDVEVAVAKAMEKLVAGKIL